MHGIDGAMPAPHFKMQVWPVCATAAQGADDFAGIKDGSARDSDLIQMCVGAHIPPAVLNQHQVSVAGNVGSGMAHLARCTGTHRSSARGDQVNSLVPLPGGIPLAKTSLEGPAPLDRLALNTLISRSLHSFSGFARRFSGGNAGRLIDSRLPPVCCQMRPSAWIFFFAPGDPELPEPRGVAADAPVHCDPPG